MYVHYLLALLSARVFSCYVECVQVLVTLTERHDIRDISHRCWQPPRGQSTHPPTQFIHLSPTVAPAMPTPTTCRRVATASINVAMSHAGLTTDNFAAGSRTGAERVTIA